MFYGLARELIPRHGLEFQLILQDIQTLNERATRGELDVSAISFHAYAYVSGQYALLPSGASMGDGYGPMSVARRALGKTELARQKDRRARHDDERVPGPATLAGTSGGRAELCGGAVRPDFSGGTQRPGGGRAHRPRGPVDLPEPGTGVVPGFRGVVEGGAGGLPLPLGGNVVHKRLEPATRRVIAEILKASIQFGLQHRAEAVGHALPYARDMGRERAEQFVGMYVNHWTLDYGEERAGGDPAVSASGARAGAGAARRRSRSSWFKAGAASGFPGQAPGRQAWSAWPVSRCTVQSAIGSAPREW